MSRTHLMLALTVGLALLQSVEHNISFLPVLVLATLLPDVDCASSYLGRRWFWRPMQWFVKHRGMLHSMTFCLGVTAFLALFVPVFALPFFLGYALHLFADSLTVEGVRLWWPAKAEVRGKIRTGGDIEKIIFYVLCGTCAVLIAWLLSKS